MGEGDGLSPRARGNRKGIIVPLPRSGPIPASAGEPECSLMKRLALGAYPRERGGTLAAYRSQH